LCRSLPCLPHSPKCLTRAMPRASATACGIYSMRHLLLFSVLATLADVTSYQRIIALQRERLNAVFGVCFRCAPAVNTLRHLFLALGGDDLEAAFRRHACDLNAHGRPEAMRTVALDGKTLRSSFNHLTDPGASGTGRGAGRGRSGAAADGRAWHCRRVVHRGRAGLPEGRVCSGCRDRQCPAGPCQGQPAHPARDPGRAVRRRAPLDSHETVDPAAIPLGFGEAATVARSTGASRCSTRPASWTRPGRRWSSASPGFRA